MGWGGIEDTLNFRVANIRENGVVGVIFYHFGAVVHILPFFFQVVRIPIIAAALSGLLQETVRATKNG